MALVINSSPAPMTVSFRPEKAGAAAKRIHFASGILTNLSDADWKACKKVRMVQKALDEGRLQVGKKAAKVSSDSGVTQALKDQEKAAKDKASEDDDEDLLNEE